MFTAIVFILVQKFLVTISNTGADTEGNGVVGEGEAKMQKRDHATALKNMGDKRMVRDRREKDGGKRILQAMKKSDHYH